MQRKIIVDATKIAYTIRRSKRARLLRISIHADNSVTVTIPRWETISVAEQFLKEKSSWIQKSIAYYNSKPKLNYTSGTYEEHTQKAREFALAKIAKFNALYGYNINNIRIKNQKTQWGSCSARGNLNFNYRILFLPERIAEYIVVHELCHLAQHNHSPKFWQLVAQTFPDYKEINRQLRSLRF